MTPEDAEEFTQSLGQIGGGLWRQILWAQRQGVPAALGLSLKDWVDGRLGGYVRMAVKERREAVAELKADNVNNVQAAAILGVDESTVRDDIKKSGNPELGPEKPQVDKPKPSVNSGNPEPVELPEERTGEIQELARQHHPAPVIEPVPFPVEQFQCIVIDPPWPMPKIERKTAPWQGVNLDYPTMTIADITALPVGDLAEDDCHLYLWVTHKFLPDGLRLLDSWGFRYQCVMTWRKPSGFTPFSWMYDTEHVLFATRGNLPLLKKGLRLSIDEPVNGHSVKPEEFYTRVRTASPGPRLEMFARQHRDGFTAWGNEVTK